MFLHTEWLNGVLTELCLYMMGSQSTPFTNQLLHGPVLACAISLKYIKILQIPSFWTLGPKKLINWFNLFISSCKVFGIPFIYVFFIYDLSKRICKIESPPQHLLLMRYHQGILAPRDVMPQVQDQFRVE